MLPGLIATLLALIWPGAPAWVSVFIGSALPVVFEVVDELEEMGDLKGHQKFVVAVEAVGAALDEAFDAIPEWSDLTEIQRDRIVDGLVELALFVQRLTIKDGKRSARRQVKHVVRSFRGM